VSFLAVTLAGADSPGEHLQLAAFTSLSAAVFILLGRRQRRTGRSLVAPDETMRAGDRLVQPPPPSSGRRTAGCLWIGVGAVFAVPAVFNFVAAIHGITG
jgi:hypothetical protein